jgi:AraC family transcriptional regulator of adaptative response/methylated-DNA-[protein]-cysteine methyltransferase
VRFFATAEEASLAGFRPCKRCNPCVEAGFTKEESSRVAMDKVRLYIETNLDRALTLIELGHIAGLSPFAVQRRFKKAMGATPLAYQRALRTASLRRQLREGASVTDAIYNAGFGSSSRAYEDAALGMTPARFAQGGRGERIGWCSACSKFGWIIVGATERGLCWLSLAASSVEGEVGLRAEFPAAEIFPDPAVAHWVDAALEMVTRNPPSDPSNMLGLDLRGTAFQLRVWDALRRIPRGQTLSYSALATELGNPKATRAVARACAMNRVAVLVPCHRIVGADGSLTGYRWGVERKRQLLAAEMRNSTSKP